MLSGKDTVECGQWRWFPGTPEKKTINWAVASYQQHQQVNWSHWGASLGHLEYISQHSRLTGCCLTLTLRVIHPGVCFVVKYTHCGSVAPFNKPKHTLLKMDIHILQFTSYVCNFLIFSNHPAKQLKSRTGFKCWCHRHSTTLRHTQIMNTW